MADILVVEDDDSLSLGLTYALEKEGYRVTHCKMMAEACEKAAAQNFDLALLDMQLPDGLGKEAASVLQSRHTPVIYLTVVDDEDEIVRSFHDGAADYVTKPFRMRELLARIKRALHEKESSEILKLGEVQRAGGYFDRLRVPAVVDFCAEPVYSSQKGADFGADLGYQR